MPPTPNSEEPGRYWPCLGVNTDRELAVVRFTVASPQKGRATNIRHRVRLSEAERAELIALLNGGRHTVGFEVHAMDRSEAQFKESMTML